MACCRKPQQRGRPGTLKQGHEGDYAFSIQWLLSLPLAVEACEWNVADTQVFADFYIKECSFSRPRIPETGHQVSRSLFDT